MEVVLLLSIGATLLGAIAGSFLNALLFRFNTGRKIYHGRSRCMHCSHELQAIDLVPVLSFVFLRGKCRYCGARLSFQYPLVEIAAAVTSLATFLLHPHPLAFLFWFLVWMVLLFIVVYDVRHKIIPWSASFSLLGLALVYLFVSFEPTLHFQLPTTYAFLAGPLLAAPLFLLSLVSRGAWMGWGDSLLQLSLGFLLGLSAGATGLVLAFWLGACVGIVLLFIQRGYTMKSEVPFAPFLILGAAAAHFLNVDFFSSLSLFW